MMDVLVYEVERYGVVRHADYAARAFDEAIAQVSAPGYKPTRRETGVAAAYNARRTPPR